MAILILIVAMFLSGCGDSTPVGGSSGGYFDGPYYEDPYWDDGWYESTQYVRQWSDYRNGTYRAYLRSSSHHGALLPVNFTSGKYYFEVNPRTSHTRGGIFVSYYDYKHHYLRDKKIYLPRDQNTVFALPGNPSMVQLHLDDDFSGEFDFKTWQRRGSDDDIIIVDPDSPSKFSWVFNTADLENNFIRRNIHFSRRKYRYSIQSSHVRSTGTIQIRLYGYNGEVIHNRELSINGDMNDTSNLTGTPPQFIEIDYNNFSGTMRLTIEEL
ncbi:hypothetical protein [Chitinivibrio alkaliphilus]|uniref:Uncharacterized protein n=1 Tax=Chitinivibrio alkaliphilus ACht1 TaxID=1313304 RepID=U7D5V1_9BACT|nr:hypothetical protein [Chitinivibrio alkaliphilus]ERP31323.1 hypothetical protein CALK_1812 [Chitinivibrio alkaliphilus ACht1]